METKTLKLVRHTKTSKSTIGSIYLDETFICYTLEDTIRNYKVYGETCIPTGTYKIDVTFSPRYKRLMPLLFDVPKFDGIRIHSGNFPKDTEGCILPGFKAGVDAVYSSRLATNELNKIINSIIKAGKKLEMKITEVDLD